MAEGFHDFAAAEVLTAANTDDYLMRQAVMRFADASARNTALSGVSVEGMVAVNKGTDSVTMYSGAAWVETPMWYTTTGRPYALTDGVVTSPTMGSGSARTIGGTTQAGGAVSRSLIQTYTVTADEKIPQVLAAGLWLIHAYVDLNSLSWGTSGTLELRYGTYTGASVRVAQCSPNIGAASLSAFVPLSANEHVWMSGYQDSGSNKSWIDARYYMLYLGI